MCREAFGRMIEKFVWKELACFKIKSYLCGFTEVNEQRLVMERKPRTPSKWNENRAHQAYLLALLGATDKVMAEIMGINENTFDLWKRSHPEFMEAVKEGKYKADMRVVEGFYLNCQDRWIEEEESHIWKGQVIKTKVKKFIQGDKWAQQKWLSLRQRGEWSETQRVEITNTNINITKIDLTGFTTEQLKIMEEIGLKQLPKHDG